MEAYLNSTQDLYRLLSLEQIEDHLFRSIESYPTPWKRVFGGQVLGQALHAAYQTVPEGRFAHSMHAYFILSGDTSKPILYEVDITRDGGSFTTRRVRAIQNGKTIFTLAASFQLKQAGFDHQISMPNVPPPSDLVPLEKLAEKFKDTAPEYHMRALITKPIEFRPVEKINPLEPEKRPPYQHMWIKAENKMDDPLPIHQQMLAYVSDYGLLGTSLMPHRGREDWRNIFGATIDHAIWFHRDFRLDEWLLYAMDSPSASNSRGFSRGSIFNQDGVLVASVVQEGLIRIMNKS